MWCVTHILASKETPIDCMAYKNIIWAFLWLWAFTWYLTFQGWSTGDQEQLCQTNRHYIYLWIHMHIFLYVVYKLLYVIYILHSESVDLLHLCFIHVYVSCFFLLQSTQCFPYSSTWWCYQTSASMVPLPLTSTQLIWSWWTGYGIAVLLMVDRP